MVSISARKLERLGRVADGRGVIAAAAMDQRGSLKKSIAKAMSLSPEGVPDEVMVEFKTAVSKVLTPYASSILLDPEYGLPAVKAKAPTAGLLMAYEKTGYDNTQPGRLSDLIDGVSVARQVEYGADAIKLLLYYTPFEQPRVNEIKKAWVERIGAECAQNEIPFFMEVVCYSPTGEDEKGVEFARRKPEAVIGNMKEFCQPRYRVDVLKVEFPFNIEFVEGSRANRAGSCAYTRREAQDAARRASETSCLPFIYLSAGVDDDVFRESLELVGEAGVDFAGVLCGRATWKDGIPHSRTGWPIGA